MTVSVALPAANLPLSPTTTADHGDRGAVQSTPGAGRHRRRVDDPAVKRVVAGHGAVRVLVNNAGHELVGRWRGVIQIEPTAARTGLNSNPVRGDARAVQRGDDSEGRLTTRSPHCHRIARDRRASAGSPWAASDQ